MNVAANLDDTIWGLPGALTTPPLPGAGAFCATPLVELLRVAAARAPEAIAVTGVSASLNYRDLLRLAENAAGAVAERVPLGRAVAWLARRQPDAIAALLGCLISGRPCLVLDANDPPERHAAVLADAAPSLLIAAGPLPGAHPVLTVDTALSGPDRSWRPDHVWDPDAPFAIHFTSGSTGRPKGIVLSARSVLYRALQTAEAFAMTAATRMSQPDAPVASTGLSTLLGLLCRGGLLVLTDLAREGAGATLVLIEREGVTCASVVPSTMLMLSRLQRAKTAFGTWRQLRLGAGALLRADVAALRAVLPPACVISHAYASTEALIVAKWDLPADDARDELTMPAGILHLRHEYALLDENGHEARPGEAGELVLRSRYVALGEWRGGALVPGRMTPVPGRPGWRLFRTGDVIRVGADGLLRVVGRVDRQVKINGVLVQPAEVEAVLKAEPLVTDAAVVGCETASGTVLHGFVAAADADAPMLVAALRRRLAAALPAVFRPTRLTVLDRLPTLPGGKTDLVALSERTAALAIEP